MHGRRRPYTERGVQRLPCVRCGAPAFHQWQICADDSLYRPLCVACDLVLNALVLKWIGFPDWEAKLARYQARWEPVDAEPLAR